jgi:hypothetical protein
MCEAVIYMSVAHIGRLYLNGKLLGAPMIGWNPFATISVTLDAGYNTVLVAASSRGENAGLLLTAMDPATNAVLFHSDATWTYGPGKRGLQMVSAIAQCIFHVALF